jgi:hypothetical protein
VDDDRGRLTRASGALGREDRREERVLEEVRSEIRRDVATAIREELAHAVELGGKDSWEMMERMLIQQEEEQKKWRMAVDRRLEALEQAFRVGPVTPGESAQAVERGYKRARVDRKGNTKQGSANEGRSNESAQVQQRQEEGLAQSQHAPKSACQ